MTFSGMENLIAKAGCNAFVCEWLTFTGPRMHVLITVLPLNWTQT